MGGAREATAERDNRRGSLGSSARRFAAPSAASPKESKSGTSMAQNRIDEAGVSAASRTATKQIKTTSLRRVVNVAQPANFMIHGAAAAHPFKCGSNSLNAA